MALIISEREALQIMHRRAKLNGSEDGSSTFCRQVLGAHSTQSTRLLKYLRQMLADSNLSLDDFDYKGADRSIKVSQQIGQREVEIELKTDALPITSMQDLVNFYEIDTDIWRPSKEIFNFWGSKSNPNFQVKAWFERVPYQEYVKEARAEFITWASQQAPDAKYWDSLAERPVQDESGNMLEIVASDLHVGKLTREYDLATAMERLTTGVLSAYHQAKEGGLDKIDLVLLGDTFNEDSYGKTFSGTQQENTDMDWKKVFSTVRGKFAELIIYMAQEVQVDLAVIPGNHDRQKSFYLADSLFSYFINHDSVFVLNDPSSFEYLRWGKCLIGLHHGDKIKFERLVQAMARDNDTRDLKVMEWHLGHIHTEEVKTSQGIKLRRFESPADNDDDWHEQQLYLYSPKTIEGRLYHKTKGYRGSFVEQF